MSRYFKVARKTKNNEILTEMKDGTEVEVLWGDEETLMPVYSTSKSAGADLKCAEDVVIPSLVSCFAEAMVYTGKGIFNLVQQITRTKGTTKEQMKLMLDKARDTFKPTLVHTGIKVHLEDDEVAYLHNRSSNPLKHGLIVANSVGVIDADYFECPETDGEICVQFYNFMPFDIKLSVGDRVAQIVIQKVLRAEGAKIADNKRLGGHGSTGEK